MKNYKTGADQTQNFKNIKNTPAVCSLSLQGKKQPEKSLDYQVIGYGLTIIFMNNKYFKCEKTSVSM